VKFYSTNKGCPLVSFSEAVTRGLAEDGGLYMPERLPVLPQSFLTHPGALSFQEIAFEAARLFVGDEIPQAALEDIVRHAFDFPVPLIQLAEYKYVLELFHGPTLSFKDFGARFFARLLSYFARGTDRERTVLAATSGDTGSAVASGFLHVAGVRVVILYPSKLVSEIQEKQLTTVGNNVAAVEVEGTFDDCQRLVKLAFGDSELRTQRFLTSANSINVARLIPQSFYYLHACARLDRGDEGIVFSVPSGNFGNLTAGLMAKRMGLPASRFVAATNANDVVPKYLKIGIFAPRPSINTLSNAMDVGNPSNFPRLLELCGHDPRRMREDIWGHGYSDKQTELAIRNTYKCHGYLMDPHGAVGLLGLEDYAREQPRPGRGIVLATADPAKFPQVLSRAANVSAPLPALLAETLSKEKHATLMPNDFQQFREFLVALNN
jgi:threonine synthase